MPAYVALVRIRADYVPKSDDEPVEPVPWTPENAPYRVYGWFVDLLPAFGGVIVMIRRTKEAEGWRGLYRGTTLAFVQIVVQSVVSFLLLSDSSGREEQPGTVSVRLLLALVGVALIDLPFEVLLQRYVVRLTQNGRAP